MFGVVVSRVSSGSSSETAWHLTTEDKGSCLLRASAGAADSLSCRLFGVVLWGGSASQQQLMCVELAVNGNSKVCNSVAIEVSRKQAGMEAELAAIA